MEEVCAQIFWKLLITNPEKTLFKSYFLTSQIQFLMDVIAFLKKYTWYFHEKYISNILFCVFQVKYQDKDVIVREGAEANSFYIILKGEV